MTALSSPQTWLRSLTPNSENEGLQNCSQQTAQKMCWMPKSAQRPRIKRISETAGSYAQLETWHGHVAPSLISTGDEGRGEKCEIWPPFFDSVDFNALWFRNEATWLQSKRYVGGERRWWFYLPEFDKRRPPPTVRNDRYKFTVLKTGRDWSNCQ